jgi:hypothetical protein
MNAINVELTSLKKIKKTKIKKLKERRKDQQSHKFRRYLEIKKKKIRVGCDQKFQLSDVSLKS